MQINITRWSFRSQFLLGFLVCAALLGFAILSQTIWGLTPCPRCIFQRIAYIGLGVVFLIGGLHAPRGAWGRRIYGLIALIPAAAGIYVAANHVWLTHLPPDQVPSCGPTLDYLLDSSPLFDVVKTVLSGSGECAKVDWTFLGMSMPAWSLLWFLLLTAWTLYAAFKRRSPNIP